MSLWEKFIEFIKTFFKDLMEDDRALNIDQMVKEANKYKPNDAHGNSYDSVMLARDQYRRGDMQPDMLEVLKDRFPNTWEKVKKQQVNLKIYKRQIEDGAGAFIEEGEFYLVDDEGNKAGDEIVKEVKDAETGETKDESAGVHYEKDAQNFADLIKDSRLLQSLQAMDEVRGSQHRCIAKPWWDDHKGHLRLNTWPPYLYGIIPSQKPDEKYDVDRAPLVYFVRQGDDGPADQDLNYEVWGIRPEDIAESVGQATIHCILNKKGDHKINEDDANPYTDGEGENKAPMFPFVMFRDDDSTDLFVIGDGDALTVNRSVNCTLTDLMHGIKAQAFPGFVHKKSANDPEELGVRTIGPGEVLEIANDESLEPIEVNLPIDKVWGVLEKLVEADGRLNGQAASILRQNDTHPASGTSLEIQNRPQTADRKKQIGFIFEDVIELLRRIIIVHNAHCEDGKEISEKLHPCWKPGDPKPPTDDEADQRKDKEDIALNVASAVDRRMKEFHEDRETAKKAVLANAELKKELAQSAMLDMQPKTSFDHLADKEGEGEEEAPNPFEKKGEEEEDDDKKKKPKEET
jgi:hypothetical protein